MGLILGYTSHLFLDFINPSGIHLIPGFKIKLVPKSSFFATGGTWETNIVYPACLIISGVALVSLLCGLTGNELIDIIRTFMER